MKSLTRHLDRKTRPFLHRGLRAAALLMALGLSTQASAEMRIGIAMAQLDNDYLVVLKHAMDEKLKSTPDVSVQYQDGRADVVTQLNQVQTFVNQKVDAIIVVPVDTAATKNITKAAADAKIPLIYVNRRPLERSLPSNVVVVASDDYSAGVMQMEFLAEKMGGKGNIAIILGDLANSSTTDRTRGVLDVVKRYPGIKVREQQTAVWMRDKGMDLMNNWLLAGEKFDAVASNNDEMAIGAAMALRQNGIKKGSILIAGTDGTVEGLAAVKTGMLTVSVLQDAKGQGGGAIESAVKLIKKEPVEQLVMIPYRLITPDNLKEFQSASR